MQHAPTPTTHKRRKMFGLITGTSILLQLLLPFSVAEAFTPMSQGNQACLTGSSQCAPTMAACNAERAAMTGTPPPCVDYSLPGPGSLVSRAVSKGLDWVGDKILEGIGTALAFLAKIIFDLAGRFLEAMGYVLDFSIGRTIDSATYNDLQAVNIGWTAVRDFSNLFFIFALLYIAIKTILGMGGGSTKRWVANLIIAALLINFSLFATKVVIDAGNILAMGFWEKITTQQGPSTVSSATANFQQGFRINTNFDAADVSPYQRMTIYLGGALVMIVAGYVFMVGAIMMIVRTLTLLFLMIASPFAFLGFALPIGGGWAQSWFTKLIGSTFVAPAFLAMLYIDSIIINSLDLTKLTGNGASSGFAAAFMGRSDNYGIFYQFFLLIFLLLAALKVADAVSSGASGAAKGYLNKMKFAGGIAGGATFATAAALGRQVGGRGGKSIAKSETLQKLAANKDSRLARFVGNAGLAAGEKMKKGTWDARNAGANRALGLAGINTGAGSKRTYDTHGQVGSSITGAYRGTEKEKGLIETAKSRYATDPTAQRQYLQARGVEMKEKRNKELSDQLTRDATNKANIKAFEEKLKQVAGLDFKELGKMKPEEIETVNKNIATEVGKMAPDAAEAFTKSFAQSLEKLGGKEYVGMGQNFMGLDIVQRNTTGRQLAEVHTKLGDGTLGVDNVDAYRANLSKNIMWNGTDSAKNVMRNQIRQGNSNFIIDAQGELKEAMLRPADKETHEANLKNALSFMSNEDVARMKPEELADLSSLLTEAHVKAMGKGKRDEYNALVKQREGELKAAREQRAAAAAAQNNPPETPLPTIDPTMMP